MKPQQEFFARNTLRHIWYNLPSYGAGVARKARLHCSMKSERTCTHRPTPTLGRVPKKGGAQCLDADWKAKLES